MGDITFSMTSDEKDVLRGLQSIGKEQGKLREQIADLVRESKQAGAVDSQLTQQRLSALNALVAKQQALKEQGAELLQQLKDGKLTADQYKTAFDGLAKESNKLTGELRELQVQVREDSADLQKAGRLIKDTEDKTERYNRAVAELNRLKEKGLLTSKQFSSAMDAERGRLEATGKEAGALGGALSGAGTQLATLAAGFVSIGAVIATLRSEYENLLEQQGKARDANIDLATEQEALAINMGGVGVAEANAGIRDLATQRGLKQADITRAVNQAMAARGDLDASAIMQAVGTATKIRRFAPTELAGLAAATVDTQKQTGLGTDASLGFLLQMQTQSRTKDLSALAKNFTPNVGGIMQFGANRQFAGALLASLSHGMGDAEGAMTGTAGVSLAKQMREFGRAANGFTGDANYDRRVAQTNMVFDQQLATLEGSDVKNKDALRKGIKAGRERALAELAASLPEMSMMDVFQRLQVDQGFRAKFFAGKDAGGFGASFETKALPAIESLLSGGKVARNFFASANALNANPLDTLSQLEKSRGGASMQLAETDQRLGAGVDSIRINDQVGALAAIVRERVNELSKATGRGKLSSDVDSIMSDIQTRGRPGLDTGISRVQELEAAANRGWQDEMRLAEIDARKAGVPFDREAANARWQQSQEGQTWKLLHDMVEQLKGLRDDMAAQQNVGAVAARGVMQKENAP